MEIGKRLRVFVFGLLFKSIINIMYVKYKFVDKVGDPGFGSVWLPDDSTAEIADAVTFVDAILPLTDAGKQLVQLIEEDCTVTSAVTGVNAHTIEFRGEVLIRRRGHKATKWAVPLPDIKNANIDPNGTAVHKILAAVEETVRAALATLTGFSDLEVTGSFIKGLRTGASRV